MPQAALAQDLMVDNNVIIPKGEILTGLQAHRLQQQYCQRLEFQCLFCQLPLDPVNVHKDQAEWKKIPHFRPLKNQKVVHSYPCAYAGQSQREATATGEFEVAYHEMEIPSELVKKVRKLSAATVVTGTSYRIAAENDGAPDIRHQALTCHTVEELCAVYFEKIKGCESPRNYSEVLREFPLTLPGLNNDISYAQAFWSVHWSSLRMDYRIFYGAVKEVVKCQDGYLISYSIPWKDIQRWKPVAAYLLQNVLNEFDWGSHLERLLTQEEINKTRSVFLCGRPCLDGNGIVIPLESVYWIHCRRDPRWNYGRVQVSKTSLPHKEVLPQLFARRLHEFQQKFSSRRRVQNSSIPKADAVPQQGPPISHPYLVQPHSLNEIVSPPALQQESPEQGSTLGETPTSSPSPREKSAGSEKDQSWWKRIWRLPSWLWK